MSANEVLLLRQKRFGGACFIESRAPHVADYPDDRDPWILGIERAIDKSLAYGSSPGKKRRAKVSLMKPPVSAPSTSRLSTRAREAANSHNLEVTRRD